MILIINTSNLKKGGALQVAHSFLSEIKNNNEHLFYIVLSNALAAQIDKEKFSKNFKFYNYSLKLNFIYSVIGKNNFLSNLEKTIKPDCVFTVFGPSYWSPIAKHIVGFADGWSYNPESLAFNKLSLFSKFRINALMLLKKYRIKEESDLLIVETDDAKNRISHFFKIPSSKIYVVGNTYHDVYNLEKPETFNIKIKKEGEFRLLTISANYRHKNLAIIKSVIPILKGKDLNFRFILTIEEEYFRKIFKGFENYVYNLGPIDITFGPSVYSQCDALFLPTLLETFTASYPEAMKMGKPILTSDLSFAHIVCGDAAEYFDPINPQNIADKIEIVMCNHERYNELINKGIKRLETIETAESRAAKYLYLCNQVTK